VSYTKTSLRTDYQLQTELSTPLTAIDRIFLNQNATSSSIDRPQARSTRNRIPNWRLFGAVKIWIGKITVNFQEQLEYRERIQKLSRPNFGRLKVHNSRSITSESD
jgi:hypothetical protein